MSTLAVDVLVHLRTARFDKPLTYALPEGIEARVGDVVRVPLGSRQAYAYVVSPPSAKNGETLRPVASVAQGPRAFDEMGLALAQFIADTYVCSLGEALNAVVLAGAIPRMQERIELTAPSPSPQRYSQVPERLLHLIWEDLREGFSVEALLRHPEARRTADRANLLRHLSALVRSGDLRRVRTAAGARIGERKRRSSKPAPKRGGEDVVRPALTPTAEQRAALDAIRAKLAQERFAELLVHGVTGSGKTLIYLEAIADVVERGGRAIVLVPEISLTPQTAQRFEAVFGDRVAVLHSALSQRERYEAWQAAARGEVRVVVGARSAIFAPLSDVRLAVIDEAHESTYRQDSTPRYDAIAVARERMRLAGGVLVLGTATPSLQEYARARRGEVELVRLSTRASDAAELPRVQIVDMTQEFAGGNKRVFSGPLVEAMAQRLERREQTILFVNRRGAAGFMLCRACGHVANCTRCTTSLTVHRSEGLLRCHHCDLQQPIPAVCPRCRNAVFREFGIGTEKVAEEVKRLWPDARVVRMDSDTTTRIGDHARILSTFEREGDVLVGTQMVAKGLDFPNVTLVGVVAADLGLHAPDYRAAERTFGLIAQVCGRSGRKAPGIAIVQTYSPDHPAIAFAARHDFEGFARVELPERKALSYPPFGELTYIGVAGRSQKSVQKAIDGYAAILRQARVGEIVGPAPHPIAKLNNDWRWRLAIKARSLEPARRVLRERILPIAHKDRTTRLWIGIDS